MSFNITKQHALLFFMGVISSMSHAEIANLDAIPTSPQLYTGIYAGTNNSLVTYSVDDGANWGYMLTSMATSYNGLTYGRAVTDDGTMYQTTGVVGNLLAGLIYTSDGLNWNQINSIPIKYGFLISLFALKNTLYVGTDNGYVLATSNHGISWVMSNQVPNANGIYAVVVDKNGVIYVGTNNFNSAGAYIYYSQDKGRTWYPLINQLPNTPNISNLAIDSDGTLFVISENTSTQIQYNTAPLSTGHWQNMTALPAGAGHATSIATLNNTLYVGTSNGHLLHTSNNGKNWTVSQVPNDTSGITSLFVHKAPLSPLFVESYGVAQVKGTGASILVTNLSNKIAKQVHAKLPSNLADVTQDASHCSSLLPKATCTLHFTTKSPYSPQNLAIVDDGNNILYHSGLVFSMKPKGAKDYYYVYNVSDNKAYIVDNVDATGSPQAWSQNNVNIMGITENDKESVNTCNGAIDGQCNSSKIVAYYGTSHTSNYAAGLCYHNQNGGAKGTGQWYLPAVCELSGGIYFNDVSNNFSSCMPVLTGLYGLHSLGAMRGGLSGLFNNSLFGLSYWSSTEFSKYPDSNAWIQIFFTGGGANVAPGGGKEQDFGVRCVRALKL